MSQKLDSDLVETLRATGQNIQLSILTRFTFQREGGFKVGGAGLCFGGISVATVTKSQCTRLLVKLHVFMYFLPLSWRYSRVVQ